MANGAGDPERGSAQWRRATRKRLLAARRAAGRRQRQTWDTAIDARLRRLFTQTAGQVVGLYWPLEGEFETRPLLRWLSERGALPALPAVREARAPLEFRAWAPDSEMVAGRYRIPVPKARRTLAPDIVVAPLVGFDKAGYRLGYGGGYYDRSLAVMRPRPWVVGVGYELSKLATLYPRPHDIAMAMVITEAGSYEHRS